MRERRRRSARGTGRNEGDLGRRMKDRFERLKRQFVDLDQTLGEAMELLAPHQPLRSPHHSAFQQGLTWLDTQATIRIETSKVVLFRMTIVDPPATRAAAGADRLGMRKAASLRMIIADLPEVSRGGADRVGMKRAAS